MVTHTHIPWPLTMETHTMVTYLLLLLPAAAVFVTVPGVDAVPLTSSSWSCARDNDVTSGRTSTPPPWLPPQCTCSAVQVDAFVWTDVECRRRNVTSFSDDALLPLFVRRLDVSHNVLASLSASPFRHWNSLRELDASHNHLRRVDADHVAGLVHLQLLHLSHNRIDAVDARLLQRLPRLRSVDLSYNLLLTLPPTLFVKGDVMLETFIVDHNVNLSADDALAVAVAGGLQRLSLDGVLMTVLPDVVFSVAPNLRQLSVADNAFTSVPTFRVQTLQHLSLSGCHVQVLDAGVFRGVPSLRTLHLDRMKRLDAVHRDAFSGLPNLETLSMDQCPRLKTLHPDCFGASPPSLRSLSIADGGVETLSAQLQAVLAAVPGQRLRLHGNPWRCDCHLVWMRTLNLSDDESDALRCYTPASLRGSPALRVATSLMPCPIATPAVSSLAAVMAGVLLTLSALLSAVAAVEYVRRRRRHRGAVGAYHPIEVSIDPNRPQE